MPPDLWETVIFRFPLVRRGHRHLKKTIFFVPEDAQALICIRFHQIWQPHIQSGIKYSPDVLLENISDISCVEVVR